MTDMPSPITDLAAAAALQHEAYTAWVDAGFTPEQAMQLVIAFITRPGNRTEKDK
jgi:hypothetical protein